MPPLKMNAVAWGLLAVFGIAAPFLVYPVFAMKILCFALFACRRRGGRSSRGEG